MYFPGPFVFAHAPFAGTMFVNKSCTGMEAPGQCRRYFRLDRLASEDDELLGCNNKHNVSDAGVPYDENTMVLVIRRTPGKGCSFAEQALNAMAIGAGGIMYYGCKTTAPESCAPGLAITYSAQHITIPTPYMSYADGNRWMLNLKSASNTQPFIISFPATGPLVADEKAALQTIARNLMVGSPGAAGAATPGINDAAWNGWSSLRPWSTLVSEPDVDPCLNRIIGLVCEDGHVVSIYLPGVGGPSLHGRWDAAWGSFPRMRGLVLSQQNLQGDVPASLCDLTSLLTLDISGQADGLRPDVRQGVTSLPSCLGSLPNTQDLVYLAVSNNLLKELPPLDQPLATDFRGLRWLVADNNLLERLPVDASAFNARFLHLAQLDLSVNPTLVSRLPSFNGWPRLATLLLHHCGFYGPMASDAFDQLVSAITIDLSSNVLNGSLPSLSLAYFTSFNLANNLFEGGIPSSWAVSRLITLNLAHNRLTGPLNSLGSITSLKSLDLSDNWIGTPAGSDVGALVASMSPISIVTLRLDRNRITGGWAAGLLSAQTNLKTFSMSGNGLTELPSDMWNIAIKVWDLSYNNISGILPTGIPNEIVSLKLQGNPLLRVWPLPKWLEASDDMVTGADSRYSCQQLRNPTFSLLQVDVDAESLQFQGCVCVKGTFGQPPLCEAVPERAEVNPYWGFSSPEVGDRFLDMITLDQYNATTGTGGGSGSGGANNGTNGIDGNVSPIPDAPVEVSSLALPPGLSDDWYGQTERLTNGVSTTWFFNLADLFFDTTGANSGTNAGNSTNIRRPGAAIRLAEDAPGIVHVLDSVGNVTSVDSTTIAYDATMQPVRLIRLLLHISRDEFDKPSDNIFVYEGDPSLSGARVLAVLGTDRFTDPPPYPPPADTPASSLHLTQTAAYQSRYGAALGRLKNRTMVEVDVLTNQASLHFTSRATSGSHFFATYTYAFACTPTSKYFLDHTTNKCRPQLPTFTLSWRIRNSVYVVAALSMVWIIVHVISILVHWQAPMYRAASRAFMLLLLALLFLMSWGAILYAAVPSVSLSDADGVTVVSDDQDRALCIGRVWLSGLPLAGVLGVLLAKTNRVDSICQ
jgi:Leucine-rich repeat (LRR) protein